MKFLSDSDIESALNLLEEISKNIKYSTDLAAGLGMVSLDVEMETGTGKTYVYIKTMFELYQSYGWSKFIVVVPSIAIREGVKKSFEITQEHFMEHLCVNSIGERHDTDALGETYVHDINMLTVIANVTETYRAAAETGAFAPMKPELAPIEESVHKLVQAIFGPSILKEMTSVGCHFQVYSRK